MSFNLLINATSESNGADAHQHTYAVNPHGDGNTDIVDNHMHIIINGKVMEAGDDGHTHDSVPFPLKDADIF